MRPGRHLRDYVVGLVWILVAVSTVPALARTVYVSKTGNNANNGLTWATAKRTVQAGLNTALSGNQVWVAAGTYVENITLKSGVALYGGFAGNETDLAQRDWVTNKSILYGSQAGSVVTSPSGATNSARIDGFTIRNGNGTLSGSTRYGGGIYCSSSSPVIANNTIRGNTAFNGGAIYCSDSHPIIGNNTIAVNSANSRGGGVYCTSSSSPIILDSAISDNTAYDGGGIYCDGGSPRFGNNTITGNVVSRDGGGIYCSSSSPIIVNTIIAFNRSGVCLSGGTPTLQHNCVFGNTSYNYFGISDPTGTNGNISADPKLADLAYGNVHIQPDSPCRDGGDDTIVSEVWLDIDGQARIQGDHVDIGADESDGTTWPAGPYVIVRVSTDGDDANNGFSWAAAKRTVQAAINAASSSGGDVWVRAGTYPERITLQPCAHVYGGFAGTENTRDQRDWAANTTTLDGQAGGSVVSIKAGDRVSTIDGFTIHASPGAGIDCDSASPTIANNSIRGDSLSSYGGIRCRNSFAMIANNLITGNIVAGDEGGGGILCENSSPTIVNNLIAGNGSPYSGGGIECYYSSPTIVNNTITGNYGSGICCSNSSPTIANTIVAFNSSGISDRGGSTPTLRYNCVFGNTSYDYRNITDPTGTNGNIKQDPRLVDAPYGNAHIQPGSPCVDAGSDIDVQTGWPDLDGQPRIQGQRVDMGVDESDGTTWSVGPYIVVRVSPSGDDADDGLSWATAKRTVQAGIDVAAFQGGDVWVKTGTYLERIVLSPYAHVYGGFSGSETGRDQRDWTANVTTLDGQAGGSVVTIKAGHRVSVIDGFTIRNGTGLSESWRIGGGIYCSSSSPIIANNTIAGNTASSGGGGIYCYLSSPIIVNNTVTGNISSVGGGGIYCSSSSPTIVDNTITGNTAAYGGGVNSYYSSPIISNNTISYNSTSSSGGGICSYNYSFPMITNNVLAFNSSGIYVNTGAPSLRHNCVFGNTDYNYTGIADPTGTDGSISVDPLFVRPASSGPDDQWGTPDDDYGDLRLLPGSPCIDAGDNAEVPADVVDLDGDGDTAEPIPFDLAGVSRFIDDLSTPDTGVGTPPIVDIGAYEYVLVLPVMLQSSMPGDGQSLWRNQKNIIRLTFDADIVAPEAGAVMIQEMLVGGTYGDDVSAAFDFTVENDGQGHPRVLKTQETGASLQHRKWYAVRNTGAWLGVAPFTVQYVVQVGDANNDGRVLNTDFGVINAVIPIFSAADDDRRDINGDGRVLNTDFGVANSKIPSFPVAKPSGH